MSTINDTSEIFYSYMKSLAERHVLIKHTEEEPHFFRGELEEFYIGLRNRVNFPALISEGFELEFDDARKSRITSFIIAQGYSEQKDYDEIDIAFNLCEMIGDEILRKMNDDDDNPCVDFKPSGAIQIQNETERYVGIRYSLIASGPFNDGPDNAMWDE